MERLASGSFRVARAQMQSSRAEKIMPFVLVAGWVLCFAAFPQQPGRDVPNTPTAASASSGHIDFSRDIRPILSDKCFVCHGPDAANNKSKLRFDTEAHALADLGKGRSAIVRGDPQRSDLVRRITAENESIRMPPVYSGRKLTKEEIEKLTEWIRQGARWQQHWAFIAPARPLVPKANASTWPRNAIDSFVLARLEKEGLRPSAEADRPALIRRVSFDLTGLPPTPQEIDDFLSDQSPKAYEKVVDRLLASPRYGERIGFRWLDAARYADTNGYQLDGEREMWRWRDWVIEAFNRNLPFDRFVVEQLAGDLLPNPTLEQRLATGFNRNHRGNSEDGLVPEEYGVEYVVDRIDTVSTVFLGLTMGCARCHNHKYDPFTQKEYYQLYAYFNSIPEDGRFSNFGNSAPWMPAPTRKQQQELQRIESEIALTEKHLSASLREAALAQRRWEKSLAGSPTRHWFPAGELMLHHGLDESAALFVKETSRPALPEDESDGERRAPEKVDAGFKGGVARYAPSPLGQAAAFDGRYWFDAGKAANFDYRDRVHDFKDRFAISAWFYPESENSGAIVTRMSDSVTEQENNLPKGRGYGIFFVNGKVHFNLVGVWADDSFRVETENKVPIRQWHHLLAAFDSLQPYEKVKIYLNGQKQTLNINNGRLFRQFSNGAAHLRIGGGGGPAWLFKGLIDEVRIYKALPGAEQIAILACPDSLSQIAAIPQQKRNEGQRLKIRNAFLEEAAPATAQQAWKTLRELERQRAVLETALPTVMMMQELPQPRPAHVLKRGAYDAPGERVDRAVPRVLPAMAKDWPNNRLGFARWLVSPENPLTSRVTINRLWQMLFGTGLVKLRRISAHRANYPRILSCSTGWQWSFSKTAGM